MGGESSIKKILILSSLFTGARIFSAILFLFIRFIIKIPITQIYTNNFYTIRLQKKIIFLSMAGLPPSTGFFIKFIVSRILLEYNKYILLRALVFRTVAFIYIYIRIFFLRINFNSVNVKNFLSLKFFTKEIFLIPLMVMGPIIFLVI